MSGINITAILGLLFHERSRFLDPRTAEPLTSARSRLRLSVDSNSPEIRGQTLAIMLLCCGKLRSILPDQTELFFRKNICENWNVNLAETNCCLQKVCRATARDGKKLHLRTFSVRTRVIVSSHYAFVSARACSLLYRSAMAKCVHMYFLTEFALSVRNTMLLKSNVLKFSCDRNQFCWEIYTFFVALGLLTFYNFYSTQKT